MNLKIFAKIVFFISIFLFLFNCSTVEKDDPPIVIEEIKISKVENKSPRESDFQCDLEVSGIMSVDNLEQDIDYQWIIEDLKMDIMQKNSDSLDRTSDLFSTNYKKGVYFLDKSKDPLKSMLNIYKSGYYKLTLVASNINETKYYSVI
ncbi:MAG TPA: hypothetical protein PK771_10510, partial [Spirochaetota bacterium]|nr:hypothetical protein [Spirochaetota bacterium]